MALWTSLSRAALPMHDLESSNKTRLTTRGTVIVEFSRGTRQRAGGWEAGPHEEISSDRYTLTCKYSRVPCFIRAQCMFLVVGVGVVLEFLTLPAQ